MSGNRRFVLDTNAVVSLLKLVVYSPHEKPCSRSHARIWPISSLIFSAMCPLE